MPSFVDKPLEEWTSKVVEAWFEKSEFTSLKDKFNLTGKLLASLTQEQVERYSGYPSLGGALYNAIESLKQGNSE